MSENNAHISNRHSPVGLCMSVYKINYNRMCPCNRFQGLRFTQKVGPILVSWTTVLYQYLFLIIAECVFFMDVTKLFLSQSQDLEIQQTVVLFWYLIRALGNLLVVAINEVGIGFYKRDDYQFIFGLLLALSRTFYPPMAKAYRPVLGTDDMVKSH